MNHTDPTREDYVHPNPRIEERLADLADIVFDVGECMTHLDDTYPGLAANVLLRAHRMRRQKLAMLDEFAEVVAGNDWAWDEID